MSIKCCATAYGILNACSAMRNGHGRDAGRLFGVHSDQNDVELSQWCGALSRSWPTVWSVVRYE